MWSLNTVDKECTFLLGALDNFLSCSCTYSSCQFLKGMVPLIPLSKNYISKLCIYIFKRKAGQRANWDFASLMLLRVWDFWARKVCWNDHSTQPNSRSAPSCSHSAMVQFQNSKSKTAETINITPFDKNACFQVPNKCRNKQKTETTF